MRKQAKRVTVLYNVILKVARYRFCHLPFTESNPTDIEGTLQGCEYQEEGIICDSHQGVRIAEECHYLRSQVDRNDKNELQTGLNSLTAKP